MAGDDNRVAQNTVTDTVGCNGECGIGISAEEAADPLHPTAAAFRRGWEKA
jgi:hypothetical protein